MVKIANSLFTNRISSLTRGFHGRQCPRRIIRIYFKALDRGGRWLHRLEASGRAKDLLQCAMIGFDDVVQGLAGSMFCVGIQLALTLQPGIAFG